MSRVSKSAAESIGLKKATDLLKAKFSKRYDENTILKYYNIGKFFGDTDCEGYEYREGIDSDVAVSNLDCVLSLAMDIVKERFDTKDLQSLKDEEIMSAYNTFYARYIATGDITLSATQSTVKKQVKSIRKGVIDGEVTKEETVDGNTNTDTDTDNGNTDADTNLEIDNVVETIRSFVDYIGQHFEGNSKVSKALATIIKELETETETETETE